MATIPAVDDQRVTIIQRLWHELQATRSGSEQYKDLTQRIRKESDLIRREPVSHEPEP
jgi:hypothetical protein